MIVGMIIGGKNQARWTEGGATPFGSTQHKRAGARSPCPCRPDEDNLDDHVTLLSSGPSMIGFECNNDHNNNENEVKTSELISRSGKAYILVLYARPMSILHPVDMPFMSWLYKTTATRPDLSPRPGVDLFDELW